MRKRVDYCNTYGFWQVTTEGDVEGRSTRNLGTFEGHIDDIAFALADKCYYCLQFKQVDTTPPELDMSVKREKVCVSLDIESGTWDLNNEERSEWYRNFLKDRNVDIEPGSSYAGVTFCSKTYMNSKMKQEQKIQNALKKLTFEEIELLGIKK